MNKISKNFDPVSGVLTREKLASLVDLPFGQALKEIRKADPLYGVKPGEKIRWRVQCRGYLYGTAEVMAENEKEAGKLADKLTSADVDWDDSGDDFEIDDISPATA